MEFRMTLLISEVLDLINAAKTTDEKLRVISDNWTPGLKNVLRYMYDPNIKFFTDKLPDYKPDYAPIGISYSSLHNESKKLYIFHSETKISAARKNVLLIQMLETIHEKDAALLCSIIAKTAKLDKLPYKTLKEKIPQIFE
jgi:hypothetical protein